MGGVFVRKFRALTVASLAAGLAICGIAGAPPVTAAESEPEVRAYVDGHPIPISQVWRYYCDDFSYPVIQCSSLALVTETRGLLAAAAGVDYATIYDHTSYSGGFMHISQDYGSLLSIGWNDKVSSFKGRNSETGRFWTDWFGTGTSWSFCCNQNVSSLGAYNNTFSSVHRT